MDQQPEEGEGDGPETAAMSPVDATWGSAPPAGANGASAASVEPEAGNEHVPSAADGPADPAGPPVYVGTVRLEATPEQRDQQWRGTPLWRRIVALLGLSAFSVLGGIVIALTIAALIATAAIVLQLVIS